MNAFIQSAGAAIAGASTLSGAAAAQTADPTNQSSGMFDRDRNMSVSDRVATAYPGGGFQRGAFIFAPEFDLGLAYDDNIFATASNEEGDIIAELSPRLDVFTTWSRHALSANISATARQYADFDDESVLNWNAGGAGRLDIVRGAFLEAGVGYTDGTEPRTSAGASGQAAEPVEFATTELFAGAVREFGRWKVEARADILQSDYDDTPLFGGGVADQDFRDRDAINYTFQGDYAISPDTSVFARARFKNQDYDLAPPSVPENRNSDGYAIQLGSDFDIRGTARGEISAGYTEQNYDAGAPTRSGLSFGASVEWFPTRLTTFGLQADRSIQESAVGGSTGRFATSVGASVNHELRRDLIVNAGVTLSEDDYNNIDRTDDRVTAEVGVDYYLNQNVALSASYRFEEQNSGGAAGIRDFTRNVIGISLTFRP